MSETAFMETVKDFPVYSNKLILVLGDLDDDEAQKIAKDLSALRKSYYYYRKQYQDPTKYNDKIVSKFMLVVHNGYLMCAKAKQKIATTKFEGDEE